MVKEEEEE